MLETDMPIYEYSCRRCDHIFETFVDGDEAVECPKCRERELERLLSLPARPLPATAAKAACSATANTPPCGPMCSRWNS